MFFSGSRTCLSFCRSSVPHLAAVSSGLPGRRFAVPKLSLARVAKKKDVLDSKQIKPRKSKTQPTATRKQKQDDQPSKKTTRKAVSVAESPDVEEIRSLLRISSDGEEALRHWEKKPSKVKMHTYDVAIQVASRTNISKAQQYFREMIAAGIKPPSSTFDDLIYSPDRRLTFEKGIHYYSEMVQMGVAPTDNTLRQILELCIAHHRISEAAVFFEELKRKWNVSPTRLNYQRLIDALRKVNRMQTALRYFRELEQLGTPPADIVIPLIIQLCRSNLVDDALKLYEKYYQMEPNQARLISLLALACGRAHKGAMIVPVYEAWKKRGHTPDFALLNTLIDCFAKSRLPDQAQALFDEMKALKFEPTEATLSLMMKAYGPKRLRVALQFYTAAKESGLATTNTFTLGIRLSTFAGDISRAFQIYADMLAAGCEPTNATFALLLQCCGKTKDEVKMRELFDSMKDFGLRPNEEVYMVIAYYFVTDMRSFYFKAMISSFGSMGLYDEAIRHFFAVEQSGLHQSELTYAAVISACGQCNHLDKALEFFEEMKVLEMRRGSVVYEALIRACIHCFRSDLAVWHYQQMLNAQLAPSPALRLEVENAIEKRQTLSNSTTASLEDDDSND